MLGHMVFRSTRAPASLKPLSFKRVGLAVQCIPEHACSGLIEARDALWQRGWQHRIPEHACSGLIEALSPEWVPAPAVPVFRSTRAPASLKRSSGSGAMLRSAVFRSTRAPASLKPAMVINAYCTGHSIPEHACSGLIEARAAASCTVAGTSYSGARVLRPH